MLLSLLFAATAHAETSYALGEDGLTLDVGPGWHMSRWSDWDFLGHTNDNGVFLDVWYTPFQQDLSADGANAWAKMIQDRVEGRDHVKNTKIESATVEDVAGRKTVRVELGFELATGGRAVLEGASFAVDGKVMHLTTMAAAANAGRARSTLDGILTRSTVTKPAKDLAAQATLKTDAVEIKLPAGWRTPLPGEQSDVESLYGQIAEKDAAKCAPALQTVAGGTANLALVCEKDWKLPILDHASFADVSHQVLLDVFGKAAEKVAPPEEVALPDRTGILIRPSNVLRLGVLPYKADAYALWMAGQAGHDADLDVAIKAMMTSTTFAGGGAPEHTTGEAVFHTIQYNPTNPFVLGSGLVCLGVFGGLLALVFKKRPHPPSYMDHSHHG